MYLIRFMSFNEFEKLMSGETLINVTDHKLRHKTNSVGFCFFEIDKDDMDDLSYAISEIYTFLSGIVSNDVAVIFDSMGTELKVGYGIYADPYGVWFDTFYEKEYSITQYNKHTLKPLYCANNIREDVIIKRLDGE